MDPDEISASVDDARREVRYVVTDFSAELIVSKYREENPEEGDVYIPNYQRSMQWSLDESSYFIESLIMRIPVTPVFFYDVRGRLEIVDGSQRIRSLVEYLADGFALSSLEKLDGLNGLKFSDLPAEVQRRLKNTPIRSFVLDEGTDESTRIDVFKRLNTSGKKLHDAEIRRGAYRGPFLDLVMECAQSDLFQGLTRTIGGAADPESERLELVTRFFVYRDRYRDFRHDVRKFLDRTMIEYNEHLSPAQLQTKRDDFFSTMHFIYERDPRAFYRTNPGRKVPRVRFEAVAVGTALALADGRPVIAEDFDWLKTPEFEALVRTDASNSAPRLRGRIEFVRDRLLGVIQ